MIEFEDNEFNEDWKYDLKIGNKGENEFCRLLRNGGNCYTVECKSDSMTHRTGNFYIEYKSRGKHSGLKKTEADYYSLQTMNKKLFLVVPTDHLKKALRSWQQKCVAKKLPPEQTWAKKGGDDQTSVGMLVPVRELIDEILQAM